MDARPFVSIALNKDRGKSEERREKSSSAASTASGASFMSVRDDDAYLRGIKRTFIQKATSNSFNSHRQRRLPIHQELPTPPLSFEKPHEDQSGLLGEPAFQSKEVDVDQVLAEFNVKTSLALRKSLKATKPKDNDVRVGVELKSKQDTKPSKFSTISTRPLNTAALRRGEIMRRDSDSCYSTTESAIMDEPLHTSTPVRPKDANTIRIKSELSDHLLDTSSLGDSGIGNSSAGRRTQSLELLSEDVTSNCSQSTIHRLEHGSRAKGRSRTPARRGKSEEIVLNKRKGQPKPPFVVPKRPLSSASKDIYLSSSSLGHGVETGTSTRRHYYSGCAAYGRRTSESSHRAPVSEAGSTPYRRPLFGQLKKSTSIPVQLTVTNQTSQQLPKSLRPDCCTAYSISNSSRLRPGATQVHHDPNCEVLMNLRRKNWNSSMTLTSGRSTPTPTSTRRPVKSSRSIERNSQEEQKSSTLPRDSKRLIPNSKSLSNDLSKIALNSSASNLPSATSSSQQNLSTSASERPRTPSTAKRRVWKKAQQQKTLSASMEIWEIQKELKRGEMVQGMLQFGPSKNCTFGSGRDTEPRICAPVSLGRTSGHMDWRSM